MSFEQGFLENAIKRFRYYKELGDKTFEQLADKDFFFQPSPESNSIAIIVQHMLGNMLSRFTNFLTEDGEKPWRKRDAEFERMDVTAEDIRSFWNSGWELVFSTLERLTPPDLQQTITIRGEPLLAYDAILRQLAHYSYHIGQIVYIGKCIKDAGWISLSIPKGQSQSFNEQVNSQFRTQ